MTSAGGYKPSQLAQVFLFTIVKEAAMCSRIFGFVCLAFFPPQLGAELWNSIYMKRSNYATSEQAQEVKLTGPPQQSTEHNAALKLLGGFSKKPMCHA